MHVMIISDLDVQLIMLLLDDVRLEVYFLTKKKKEKKKYSFSLCWVVWILQWFIMKSTMHYLNYFMEAFFFKLDFDSLWQLELSCKVIKKCLCIFIME